ncbi:MAG: Re/Si-specific NAD(P)(+) transhydrogenase subunit alpha [Geminicoccaceae bacterium]|nr:Re/Si-specific NAD(P)(+) transhydrogenase subunit alpha [Geminicoccaceae bacterium]
MKIGVPKERRPGERRVAASPDTVKRFVGQKVEVLVEKGAGAQAAMLDEAFEKAGAKLVDDPKALWSEADVILKVQRPLDGGEGDLDEMGLMKKGLVLVGSLNPHQNRDQVDALAKAGVSAFAMELLPRTTRAQSMDVLSSQANLAGYKAVLDGLAEFPRAMPMMMTAAGTVPPAKVFILGAGVAGLQAIATARRLGAVVAATDVRPASREEVESLGAKFIGVPIEDAATKGGYARQLTPEEQKKQAEMVAETLKSQDLVITTAAIPGRKAPVLITKDMVETMKPGSVIVDLAVETGGNCELSKPGEVVEHQHVKIVGHTNVPSRLAPDTTLLYARNLYNFVQLLIDKDSGELNINLEDDLVKGTLITHEGAIVHEQLKQSEAA